MAEFVVLASGSGTNFEAIAQAFRGSDHNLQALITDNPSAYALVRAENLGVPSIVVDYGAGRAAAEKRLLGVLTTLCPDLVVLAGFMKILPSPIVSAFTGRIVNIHPSILPAHPGMHAIERSFAEPSCRMGITIHTVDDGVDTGPVLAQFEVERTGHETLEEMERRIHELEHTHYPR
ncbi:MAG: phosphoribosylglycinamide formyltransferase, partial [Spirochaetota bacterium]